MGLDVFSSMSSFLGSVINTAGGIYNNERNISVSREHREDNQAFEAEQAQLNRDFQSKEAELAFEREVDFYEKYKSPSAMVQQYMDAGLNPALLAGGIGSSTSPSASAPSGSAGHSSGSAPVNSNPFSFAADAFDFAGFAQAIELRKQEIKIKREEAEKLRIENKYRERREQLATEIDEATANLTWERIEEVKTNIRVGENRILIGNSEIEVNASQATLNAAKTAMENFNLDQAEEMRPLLVEYQAARNETEQADAALKIAQKCGVEAQTSRTETGESLDVAGEVREGVVDTVTTGVLIADFVGEILGVDDMGQRWTQNRETRYKDGSTTRTTTTREVAGKKTSKKKRRRR